VEVVNETLEFSFGRLFGFFRRWFLLALVASIATAAAMYLWTNREAPSYYAEAVDYVNRSGLNTGAYDLPEFSFSPLNVTAYRIAALSDEVLGDALLSLGTEASSSDIDDLRRSVSLFSDEQPGLLYVGVTAGSPEEAAGRANAIAQQLAVWDANRAKADLARIVDGLTRNTAVIARNISELQSSSAADAQGDIAIQQALLADQQRKIATAELLRESVRGGLGLLTAASPPLTNVSPRPVFSAALAFLSCMVLVFGLLYVRDLFATQLYTVPEISSSTGVAVVAALPHRNRRGEYPVDRANALRETLRNSRANSITGKGPSVIHFTSAEAGNASLAVAVTLAESYARSGARTLLVDADMRTPRLGKRYRIAGVETPTLSDALRGVQTDRNVSTILVSDSYPMDVLFDRLRVSDPGDLVAKGLASRVLQWKSVYDTIVIHSAPLLSASDGIVVSSVSDATLLVVRERKARRRSLLEAVTLLRRTGTRAVGIVVTGTTSGVRPSMLGVAGRSMNTDQRKVDF
jgi:Mrp family chromosome partitioning ATPase